MKCVCGYERISINDYDNFENKEVGTEDFIEIKGIYTVDNKDSWYGGLKEVQIFACPECGTLKMK